jgi:hypothetical protein
VSAVRFRPEPSFFLCGGVAKWLNAADCKSAPSGFGGSNPSPSTKLFSLENDQSYLTENIMAVVAKWLTHLIVVQAFVGSIPISRPIYFNILS